MLRSIAALPWRRLPRTLSLVVAAVLLVATPAAAWNASDIRISEQDYNASMYDNELMAVDGAYMHYFFSSEDGPTYRRGTLNNSIVPYARLAVDPIAGDLGDAEGIDVEAGLVGVVYTDNSGPKSKLFARFGGNHGQNWGDPIKLASYNGRFPMGNGSIAMSGTTVVVAWTDGRNGNVNLRRSTDSGGSFGTAVLLGTTSAIDIVGLTDGQVHLGISGSGVVATWNNARVGYHPAKLVLRRSKDGGATFKPVQMLDSSTQAYDGPSVAMAGKQVLISHATKPGHVRVLRSTDGGKTFTSTDVSGTKVTDDRSDVTLDPANPLNARVVWSGTDTHIYMRRSADGGVTWTPQEDTLAVGQEASYIAPNVIASGGRTIVTWNAFFDDDFVWQIIGARTDG